MRQPIDADVSTCTVCGETIFRTNVDGNWHHRREGDHAPEPQPDKKRY
jgi:hypothetical protein